MLQSNYYKNCGVFLKFIIFFILIFSTLYAEEESCYSVQIISAQNSAQNFDRLLAESDEPICKLMNINETLTVRCGCYEDIEQAKVVLQAFKKVYKDAYIRSTYKYRFVEQKKVVPVSIVPPKKPKKKVVPHEDSEEFKRKYALAVKYFNAKKYEMSYAIFSEIYLMKLSDPKLNFYLGRSAYEIGHYEVAIAAFERVEMLDSGNLRNKLAMAKTYYMLKMYTDSQLAFDEVMKNPNFPENIRKNIDFYRERVTKVQQKSFTYANINLDWIYDSNVNYASLDSQYTSSIGTFPTVDKVSDSAWQLYGDITNLYDIGEKDGFVLKNRVSGLIKNYLDQDAYDMRYISYEPSLVYGYIKHMFELGAGVDDLHLGTNNFLQSFFIIPSYSYQHTNTLQSMAYFKYQRKFFQRATEYDLNADHYELSYSLHKIFSSRSVLQGSVVGIKEQKHHGNRVDVDYYQYILNTLYTNQFTNIFGTELYADIQQRDYSDTSTLFNSRREDSGLTMSAKLNANIDNTLGVNLKGMYNRVHSNQDIFSYQKYTISLGINKVF